MTSVTVPSRNTYSVSILVGTTITGTISYSQHDIVIAPVKSTPSYTVSESTRNTGAIAIFPSAS